MKQITDADEMETAMSSTNQQSDKPAPLILIGGGGHAKVVAESAIAQGWMILGYLDDQESAPLADLGVRRIGSVESFFSGSLNEKVTTAVGDTSADLIVAIGDNKVRCRLIDRVDALNTEGPVPFSCDLVNVVDPTAVVSRSVSLHGGVFVAPRAVINASTIVEIGAIINTATIVEHDNRIGRCAHIAPGTVLGGNVQVGEESLVGLGVCVRPGTRIGRQVVIGAGAVVVSDIPDHAIATGVPADFN